ncbi:D-TA family PLP-dependent enzyme [Pollutibacter soli]|uniref:D-TA family PLP-dependent enzyme n=1 Tax=Pollutibacter soli TaxID=3034157 RepID=UPI0030132050
MNYKISEPDKIDSPALVVFPELVKKNIEHLVSMADDVSRLRPHIKTHKTAEGIQLMMKAGISKFKCATIAEAELLGLNNAPDVVLAYQPGGPKLKRFLELIKKYPGTEWACLTDNILSASAMSDAFAEAGLKISVYIDLNTGMNRSGIVPGAEVIELYGSISKMKGIVPKGLHAYDGHQRNPDFAKRKEETKTSFEAVYVMQEVLKSKGFSEPVIIAGGSPTFPVHIKSEKIECSPGTCIFWDKGYSDLCAEQPFTPAAVLLTRVISLPTPERITLDLGHKSVAPENEIGRRVYFPGASELKPVAQSEEHLVMETAAGHGFKIGDLLIGIPFHICPTVSMYDRMTTVEDGKVTGEWRVTARDRKITI